MIIKMRSTGRQKSGLINLMNFLPDNMTMAEIGCYSGESMSIFLGTGKVKKYYAIDPWLNDYNKDDEASSSDMKTAEKLFDDVVLKFKHVEIIKIKNFSYNAINLINEPLDFLYIDGNHLYDSVKHDIISWKNKTKFIGGHDYGRVKHEGVKKAVDEIFEKVETFRDSSWLAR